ncbi:MAG: ABC transporter ATP-binding protein [Clostridiaceae bacterium]|jgi:putative ABC transport system ATP-binding protein|nr:ABC transporter ATP-binding protein [Clostridiaceae bacterium]
MSLVEMKDINKYYESGKNGTIHALKNVSLSISQGEFISLMGVSGSGKSTLLNIIGCCDRYDSGTYLFDGKDVKDCTDKEKALIRNKGVGFVLQNLGLIQGRTVLENVMLPLLLGDKGSRVNPEAKAKEVIEALGIGDKIDTVIEELSGGQKQRVAIARAVVNSPKLILADEPTAALDSKTAIEVMELLKKLNKELSCAILVSTHDPLIAKGCNRQLWIEDGVLVERE